MIQQNSEDSKQSRRLGGKGSYNQVQHQEQNNGSKEQQSEDTPATSDTGEADEGKEFIDESRWNMSGQSMEQGDTVEDASPTSQAVSSDTSERPFHYTTGNVSGRYETGITPAGWTFSIWGVIYTWLTLMVIYITSYVCRGSWAQCLLPYAFYFCWLSNMVMNMIWLLVWDRELMLAALVLLILIAFSNYSALFFVCYATDYYGLWLQTYHRKDLACLRILVQNGLAVYTTWTSIASLINFSLVLHLWGVDKSTAATASLCILFAEVVVWFILENWLLDRWVRNILTVYPVVIVALVGNVYKHFDLDDPTPNSVFMVVLLVLACILFISRFFTVLWRNRWRPLYSPGSARLMVSPLDGKKFRVLS